MALVKDLTIIVFHISLSLISDEAAYAYIDDCGDNRPLGGRHGRPTVCTPRIVGICQPATSVAIGYTLATHVVPIVGSC